LGLSATVWRSQGADAHTWFFLSLVAAVGGELPSTRHRWVLGTHWAVDEVGDWAQGKVDGQGYTYVLADGRREAQMVIGGGAAVQSRRRRLVRKAYIPIEGEDGR